MVSALIPGGIYFTSEILLSEFYKVDDTWQQVRRPAGLFSGHRAHFGGRVWPDDAVRIHFGLFEM